MDNLPHAMIMAGRATRSIAHSALPDAPVVARRQRRPAATLAIRTRARLTGALRAVAALVAPEPAAAARDGGPAATDRPATCGHACVPTA